MTRREALQHARAALAGHSPSPDADAQRLLLHAAKLERTALFTDPDAAFNAITELNALLKRRRTGEPVAYLTGQQGFHSLTLAVTADTLIPRPETEQLVDLALTCIADRPRPRILDLGTGSGAIALAIARQRPDAKLTATDRSAAALAVAQRNADRHGLTAIQFLSGHWFNALPAQHFDLIVANPPYIPQHDRHLNQGDVAHEPRQALTGGADGLDDLRTIVAGAPAFLSTPGWLIVEHGFDQGPAVTALFAQAGFKHIASHRDLAGWPRNVLGRLDTPR